MTFKDKLILITLSIITLGIYPAIIFNKKSKGKSELKASEKITVDLTKLVTFLGGKANISAAEFTHTKVKVMLEKRESVNIEGIQKLKGVSGVFATSAAITIIVGPQAKTLANKIIDL